MELEEKIFELIVAKLGKTQLSDRTVRAKAARIAKKLSSESDITDEIIEDAVGDLRDIEGQYSHDVKTQVEEQLARKTGGKGSARPEDSRMSDDERRVLEEFRKNPVMLLNHDDWSMPIGRWENIRIEGGRILADAVFDESDPRAAEVMRKVDEDFIRMASIGAWPPEETSDAYDLMAPGQTGPTVTRWTVREASIVTIGANHNALAFYDRKDGKIISMDKGADLVRLMDEHSHNQKTIKMGKLTELLNLRDDANEQSIADAVSSIIKDRDRLKSENKTLSDAIDRINTEKKESQKKEAVELVDAAIRDGRYDAKGRDSLLALFDRDFAGAKTMLESIPARKSVQSQIQSASGTENTELADLSKMSWNELDKGEKLARLKDLSPEIYRSKFKERFGVEPKE